MARVRVLVGDILKSEAQTLVNTVNCVGVMGKGIAMEFKNRFPDMFHDYAEKCERGEVRPGMPYLYKTLYPPHIVNFPTKDHWKSASKISDVEHGLEYLLAHYKEWGITSLALPPLGCGNGQLEWREVGPVIYKFVSQMTIPVEMYAPHYVTSPKELTIAFLEQETDHAGQRRCHPVHTRINPAWVALVEILHRIEKNPYHWPVGRIIFQKIAYIASWQGLPTGVEYHKRSYGPFSDQLKIASARLVNNNLLQEERRGSMFMVKTGPNYERIRSDYAASLARWEPIIHKTADLFMRLNTDQAEIVATVIFAAEELKRQSQSLPNETDVLDAVMEWKKKRREPLKREAVASAIRNLGMLRWLDVRPDANLPLPKNESVAA